MRLTSLVAAAATALQKLLDPLLSDITHAVSWHICQRMTKFSFDFHKIDYDHSTMLLKPQEYKTLSTARHGGGQADELKSFAELWAGSIQVAQRQGVAARLLHIFGDDLRLMLHVENIIGYALVLRWRALGHELQMQAHC